MRIAIVTGASSGIGQAFVRELDKSMRLDEIWLIARREDRLQALSDEIQTKGVVIPLDLLNRQSIMQLRETLEGERPEIACLVCAAGFGKFGRAEDMTLEENDNMISLNCRAAVDVTYVCIPFLTQGSRVLEICSCAAFQPLPGMNLYAATKSFLLRYTRALRWEMASKGVKITAVCPAWVKTEFEQIARDTKQSAWVGRGITKLAQRPEAIAAWALTMNGLGAEVVTCGPAAFLMRVCDKFLPACVPMAAWEGLRRI